MSLPSGVTCPFAGSACIKRGKSDEQPYPVCSVYQRATNTPIVVCPKRFNEVDIIADVARHVWPNKDVARLKLAREIKMDDFGNVDFVLSEIMEDGGVNDFVCIELQAIDITGTVRDAYDAIISGHEEIPKKSFGLNWKNVYKRYVYQLISKGFYSHHWGTKIVSVLQQDVYDYIKSDAKFPTTSDITSDQSNVIFMPYKMMWDGVRYKLTLGDVEATHHSNLQAAILYKTPPDRKKFVARIEETLRRQN